MIYAVIGISGVGKSYLVNYALKKRHLNLKKLIAVTTRQRRLQEIDGEDKYFLSKEQFALEKKQMVFVRSMYGAFYGFRVTDLESGNRLIVELYYKDYLQMRKEGYGVKGIYVWTPRNKYRKEIVSNRHCGYILSFKRAIADSVINVIHKIMLKQGLFDYTICNCYDELSKETILGIIDSEGEQDDSGR